MKLFKTLLGFVGTLGGFVGTVHYALQMASETAALMEIYGTEFPREEGIRILISYGPYCLLFLLITAAALRSLQRREK